MNIFFISAQNKMQYYEDYISNKCLNCANAELNEFLIKERNLKDTLISVNLKKFVNKIENKIQNRDDEYSVSLTKIKEEFLICYNNWINLRELSSKSYSNIMSGGTASFLYFGLMYLMISDEIIEFINCYDNLTFG
jgi:hypothetical protein